MKLLIVKLGAIGDIVHTLPVLAMLQRVRPDVEVSWVAEGRSAEILRGNPLIENLIEVDTRSIRRQRSVDKLLVEAAKQIKGLRRYRFDMAIDFQGLLKSAVISKLSGAKQRWGFSRAGLREPASRVFYTDTVEIAPMTHVIKRNLELARSAFGIQRTDTPLEFPIATSDEHTLEADQIVSRVGEKFAILNPAGGWATKLWHAGKYGRLADLVWHEYQMPTVVATGPGERRLAAEALGNTTSGKAITVEPGLKGFYELAKRATVYIGGDTGPTHLAIAAGTPVVGIFGPTEWWRNGSPDPDDICVERVDIECRTDCHRRTCSKWICMDISPETVFDAVRTRLARVSSRVAPVV